MPFAGYPDFRACVLDNSDKNNPEAFCAWLENQTTGSWPGEMTFGLPEVVKKAFWEAFGRYMASDKDEQKAMDFAVEAVSSLGWVKQRHGWARVSEHRMDTISLYGVPIFAVGQHNDENYTDDDLGAMVDAFHELKGRLDPPVKIGHTSDEFNKALAEKMGIVPEMIEGEAGNGVMAFGWIDDLRIDKGILFADLVDVPVPIAELIESKSYMKVSAEVMFDFFDGGKVYPRVLSGLALLGGELPAVRESGLESAVAYVSSLKPDKVVEFAEEELTYDQLEPTLTEIDHAIETTMRGKAGVGIIRAMWKEVKQKVKGMFDPQRHAMETENNDGALPPAGQASANIDEGSKINKEVEEMNAEVLKALGLDEQATDAEALAAVKKLQEGDLAAIAAALGLGEEATLEDIVAAINALREKMVPEGEFKVYADRIATLEKDNKDLKRKARKAEYKERVTELSAISGTPDKLAEDLVALEEAAGVEQAEKVFATYKELNDRMVKAGVFAVKGSPAEGNDDDEHEFSKKVKAYMEEHAVDEPTAFDACRKADHALYRQYMGSRTRIVTRAEE